MYGSSFFAATIQTFLLNGMRHRADFELKDDGMIEINFPTKLVWKPGQHVFVRFLALGLNGLTSHPLTICSLPDETGKNSKMAFYLRPKQGFTGRLASLAPGSSRSSMPVLFEGPYGGLGPRALTGFDRILLVAGGSGGSFILPLLQNLVRCATVQTRTREVAGNPPEIEVVWAARHQDSISWFTDALDRFLPRSSRGSIKVCIHITRSEGSSSPSTAPSSHSNTTDPAVMNDPKPYDHRSEASDEKVSRLSNDMVSLRFEGRPSLPTIIDATAAFPGSVGVVVCGPSSMNHDVRNATSDVQARIISGAAIVSELYLHTENYSYVFRSSLLVAFLSEKERSFQVVAKTLTDIDIFQVVKNLNNWFC